MKLIFRGAAQEVGRSCIEVQTQGDRYLLDCGVKFTEGGFAYCYFHGDTMELREIHIYNDD